MRRTETAVYLLLIAVTCTGLGYLLASPDPEIITEIEVIEVPQIIIEKETIVKTVEVPMIVTQTNTTIHTIHIPTPIKLRDFPDRETLESFIEYDNTDTFYYKLDRWNCMDYAMRVIKNAEQLGYRVIFVFREELGHAVCMAYCESEAVYVAWAPRSDEVLWVWQSTEAG